MTVTETSSTTFRDELNEWRAKRERSVSGPYGSAAVIGTHWLTAEPIVIPGLPGLWSQEGRTVVARDLPPEASFTRAPDFVDEANLDGSLRLDEGEEVLHEGLNLRWFLRLTDLAVRVFDQNAHTRTSLRGIGTFPADERWVIDGRFESFSHERITTDQSDGTTYDRVLAGRLVFEADGGEHSLLAVQSPVPGHPGLLVTFSDATSGKTSAPFRFLLLTRPEGDGPVVIDFNRAYLPPFAFGPSHSCPLPPAQNRLPIAVTAGETFPLRGE